MVAQLIQQGQLLTFSLVFVVLLLVKVGEGPAVRFKFTFSLYFALRFVDARF